MSDIGIWIIINDGFHISEGFLLVSIVANWVSLEEVSIEGDCIVGCLKFCSAINSLNSSHSMVRSVFWFMISTKSLRDTESVKRVVRYPVSFDHRCVRW